MQRHRTAVPDMTQSTAERRLQYLQRMGVDAWVRRAPAAPLVEAPVEAPLPQPAVDDVPAAATPADWDALAAQVAACRQCQLCETRTQTVFGVGDRSTRLMVIGEAPGADEDRQGEPFVGRAGKLLDQMLRAMGWPRERVYIANILKCRPPNNRDPRPEEVAACESYLQRQIALVQPSLLLAVGRIAAQNLLKTDLPTGKLRGQVHRYGTLDTPLVVTYHPAYLLRSPKEKARAWDDLKLARTLLAEESS